MSVKVDFRRAFVLSQVAVLCACVGLCFAFPGAPPVLTVVALAVVWVLTSLCYRRMEARSAVGWWTLLAAMALLSCGLIVNVWYFTTYSGGTVEAPVLHNNDASLAWSLVEAVRDGQPLVGGVSRRGYGLLMAGMSYLIGRNIVALLSFNVLATMLTILCVGAIAAEVEPRRKRTAAATAMVMIAAVCYFLASGVVLIKDALMCLVVASTVLALLKIRSASTGLWRGVVPWLAVVLVSGAVAAFVRPNLLPLLMPGGFFLLFRRDAGAKPVWLALGLCVLFGAMFVICEWVTCTAPGIVKDISYGHDVIGEDTQRMEAYKSVFGAYVQCPWYEKLLRLPVSMAVQFLIPFPWGAMRHIQYGPSMLYAHIAYPWYAVGAMAVYFLLFCLRRGGWPLALLSLYGLFLTAATSYATGGTISRYCLPWLPAIVPAASWVWLNCRKERGFRLAMLVFVAALAVLLPVCQYVITISGGGGTG